MGRKTRKKEIIAATAIVTVVLVLSVFIYTADNKTATEEMPADPDTENKTGTTTKRPPLGTFTVIDEKLDDHLYTFAIQNRGQVSKECWVTMTISQDGNILKSKREHVGVIEPEQKIPWSMEINSMPSGTSLIEATPDCR